MLDAKSLLLSSYLRCLTVYLLLKSSGQKIEGHPVIDSLIKYRVYLEKIQPLQKNLSYQITKLVKGADDEALQHKPDLSAFVEDGDEAQALEEDEDEFKTDGVYKPPKIAPQFFDKPEKKDISKEKLQKSRLLNELRAQYDSRPEELSAQGTGYSVQDSKYYLDEKMVEKERYEEDNFVRLPVSRKERLQRKRLDKQGSLLRFQDEFDVSFLCLFCSASYLGRTSIKTLMSFLV